jgi:putative Mg2+ transporter-C (MgtC) family protein
MAAAAGLVKWAVFVTLLHFVIVLGFTPVTKRVTGRLGGTMQLHINYLAGTGVLTRILQLCDRHDWTLSELNTDPDGGVMMTLSGTGIRHAPSVLAGVEGVTALRRLEKDE